LSADFATCFLSENERDRLFVFVILSVGGIFSFEVFGLLDADVDVES
jgi:hypothetical protein